MIEMPFKLMLMCLLLGLLIPTTAYGYREVSRIRLTRTVEENIEDLLFKAKRISQQGELSREVFEFDAEGGPMASIDYVKFGGRLGEGDTIIEYRMGWWDQPMYITTDGLCITSPKNNSFYLREGVHELALTRVTVSNETVAVLSSSLHHVDPDVFS